MILEGSRVRWIMASQSRRRLRGTAERHRAEGAAATAGQQRAAHGKQLRAGAEEPTGHGILLILWRASASLLFPPFPSFSFPTFSLPLRCYLVYRDSLFYERNVASILRKERNGGIRKEWGEGVGKKYFLCKISMFRANTCLCNVRAFSLIINCCRGNSALTLLN